MSKNEGDFGIVHLDFDDDLEELPPIPQKTCKKPFNHKFIKKLLASHYYYECTSCGYSPELDYNKPKFKKCHEEYLAWKKTQE